MDLSDKYRSDDRHSRPLSEHWLESSGEDPDVHLDLLGPEVYWIQIIGQDRRRVGSILYGIEGRSPGPSHSAGRLSGNFHCLQPPKGSVLALEVETQDYWTLLGWNSLDQASVHPAGCA